MNLYDRVLAERAAATKAAGFSSLSAEQRGALADAWDRWRSMPSWSKRGQNAWYDCPRVKAALGLMPGDKVPSFIKRLKRKDLSEEKKASSSQVSYAQHLAKQQKLKSPTADEISAMSDREISKLIDQLKKKRGEAVWYGGGKFKGWAKKGELWPKKEGLDEASGSLSDKDREALSDLRLMGGDRQFISASQADVRGAVLKKLEKLGYVSSYGTRTGGHKAGYLTRKGPAMYKLTEKGLAVLPPKLKVKKKKKKARKIGLSEGNVQRVNVTEAVERFRELSEYGGIGGRIAGGRHPYRVPPLNTIPPVNVIVNRKDMTPELMAKRQRELDQRADTRERMRQLAIECDRRPLKTLKS